MDGRQPKMMDRFDKVRRIAVFQKDGTTLYDQLDHTITSNPQPISHTLTADKLWPLLQVFVKFSRDVQGGNVRRLVFRSPKAYAPSTHAFEPSAHPSFNHQIITVVYLAQNDRYVVAVIERFMTTMPDALDNRPAHNNVQHFCNSLLNFLRKEHDAFLRSSTLAASASLSASSSYKKNKPPPSSNPSDKTQNNSDDADIASSSTPTAAQIPNHPTPSLLESSVVNEKSNQVAPASSSLLSSVPVDHVKLTEFIESNVPLS